MGGGLPRSVHPYTRRARPEPAPPQTKSSCGRDAMSRSRGPPQGPSWALPSLQPIAPRGRVGPPARFDNPAHGTKLPAHSSDSPPHIQIRWKRLKHQPEPIRKNITRSRNTRLTWAPRKLLICSAFLADTIRAPRVPLCHVSALGSQQGLPWRRRQDRHRRPDAETPWSLTIAKVDARALRPRADEAQGQDRKAQLTEQFGRRPATLWASAPRNAV